MDEETARSPGRGLETVGPAAVAAVALALLALPVSTLIGELLGRKGIGLSPLVFVAVSWPALTLIVGIEDRVRARAAWERWQNWWYAGAVGIGLVGPALLGLLWPLQVLQGLPTGVPTVIAVLALPVAARAIVLRARWARNRGG